MKLSLPVLLLFSFASLASTQSLIEPNVIWNKLDVRVCWLTAPEQLGSRLDVMLSKRSFSPVDANEKLKVKSLINRTYSLDKTGIHYIGWNDCDQDNELEKSDVVIVMNMRLALETSLGLSDIGLGTEDAKLRPDGGIDKIFYSRLNRETIESTKRVIRFSLNYLPQSPSTLKSLEVKDRNLLAYQDQVLTDAIIIHEFGHMAGLVHEHCRIDRQVLIHSAWPISLESEDQTSTASNQGTPYDELSAMNYNRLGVIKSLFAAKYACEKLTPRESKGLFELKLKKSECRALDEALHYLRDFTAYDRKGLQLAYLQKAQKLDPETKMRKFINGITQKVKLSKMPTLLE